MKITKPKAPFLVLLALLFGLALAEHFGALQRNETVYVSAEEMPLQPIVQLAQSD